MRRRHLFIGSPDVEIFTNYVTLPTTGGSVTVLALPDGFNVSCAVNESGPLSSTFLEGPSTGWVGNVQYNNSGTTR
jgi:hypothetical protein